MQINATSKDVKNSGTNEGVDDLIDNMPSLENFKELEANVDLASAKAQAGSATKIVHDNVVVPLVASAALSGSNSVEKASEPRLLLDNAVNSSPMQEDHAATKNMQVSKFWAYEAKVEESTSDNEYDIMKTTRRQG
ncbi:hypothetical protein VNO80_01026 [Phaseolus coccineus]|uniref:Uncharacterized protein n=1 Tax=Phaseolus coccineus TaxID=3886 RepID=A0AAN9P4M5_PHACN